MTLKKTIIHVMLLIFLVPVANGQSRKIIIEGLDQLRFSVETIKAKPGEKLTITMKTISSMDKSQMAHNWVLLKLGTDAMNFVTKGLQYSSTEYIDPDLKNEIIAYTKLLGGGKEDTITFTVPAKKGTYEYVCTFPGHFQAGMKGKLIVG